MKEEGCALYKIGTVAPSSVSDTDSGSVGVLNADPNKTKAKMTQKLVKKFHVLKCRIFSLES
jgi:hypothetical protein